MSVGKVLLVSAIAISALAYSSIESIAVEQSTIEARKVAQSVVQSYIKAYDTRDPKAIGALFMPDAVVMPIIGPVMNGRAAIERAWAGYFKNMEGHYTIIIKNAVPVGNNVVVATDELEISGIKNAEKAIKGRAVITLTRTPAGWRYVSIAAQGLPSSGGATGSRQ